MRGGDGVAKKHKRIRNEEKKHLRPWTQRVRSDGALSKVQLWALGCCRGSACSEQTWRLEMEWKKSIEIRNSPQGDFPVQIQ
ncbi:hypothetical protein L596_007159 [Steinernema carpocapsae]|uniref:Uncharacterized protein n=1 Tax=Steinernema carpocapsae TaxID=34508 RepID=A0A4U5P8D8_STECR|nr:hypothetical protein L596_007159 [Steinernema carpocapsae]